MKQGELEQIPLIIQKHMSELEMRIMSDVVSRLKANMEITSTADWQINRLYKLGLSNTYIKQQIQKALELSQKDIDWLFSDALSGEYIRNKDIYEKAGESFLPFEENKELQELISAVKSQTRNEMNNISQSLGFAVKNPNGKIIQSPIKEFYQHTLDSAIVEMSSGASYNEVLKRTILLMTNSGLRTIDYDSGWSSRIDVAARRAIMTGFRQVQAKINEQVAKELHTNYFEVSWHGGARPTHQEWQGKVYSYEGLENVCGLGSVTGLLGANCYHQYNAFIPGISVRIYTDAQLEQWSAEENNPVEYNGRQYTKYQALQQQRKLETLMRKQRQDIKLLKEGDGDKNDIIAAKSRYRSTMARYTEFSKKMNLPQQKERIYQDGLGRIVKTDRKHAIMETTDKWSKQAKTELLMDEKSLSARKKETAVIYGSDGKFLFQKRGTSNEVVFTKEEVKRLHGSIISHNHPSGSSLSLQDIILLRESGAVEIRATTKSGVYYIHSPQKWGEQINTAAKIKEKYEEIRNSVKKECQELYLSGAITKTERFHRLIEETNKKFSERFGFEYGKETFKD